MLIASVDPDGSVDQVQRVGDGGARYRPDRRPVLGITKFKPALCAGLPCKMDFPLRLNFSR